MLVETKYGLLEGEDFASYSVFRGVPYADAPVGNRRFRAPHMLTPWIGVRSAREFAPACPQAFIKDGLYGKEFYTSPDFPLPETSEDCLYLNIWAPHTTGKEKLPVAFWIHGGGFDHGFGSEMEFDGMQYAINNVILVTINYRVGVLGFFAHEDLQKEDSHGSVGNYGILDQIAALEWVKENISAFGGDPERITIMGQSAGAMSVQTLCASPLSRNLFSGAILQSGGGLRGGFNKDLTPETQFEVGKEIMRLCGAETLEEMRQVPAEKFVEILPELYKEHRMCFRPVIDGYVLTEGFIACADNRHYAEVPYMIGMTANDISVEAGTDGRDSSLFQGCVNWAEMIPQPTYIYYFDHPLPGDEAGSFHSSELWYTLGTLDRCWRPMTRRDYRLSAEMVDCWTSFCKVRNPGHGWKPYETDSHFVRTFE